MTDMRRCIGSAKFGIEAHEAPPTDFPAQPSQKDGLGRMCKPHWNQYTSALRKAALARKAEGAVPTAAKDVGATVKRASAKPPKEPNPRPATANPEPPNVRKGSAVVGAPTDKVPTEVVGSDDVPAAVESDRDPGAG